MEFGAFGARQEDDNDLNISISVDILVLDLMKSLDSEGTKTSSASSALSAFSAFSGCKFWLVDIKFKVVWVDFYRDMI